MKIAGRRNQNLGLQEAQLQVAGSTISGRRNQNDRCTESEFRVTGIRITGVRNQNFGLQEAELPASGITITGLFARQHGKTQFSFADRSLRCIFETDQAAQSKDIYDILGTGKDITMLDLILYLGFAVVGFFCGRYLHRKKRSLPWTGKIQTAAIFILVIFMGMRMGSSEEVFANLGTIGVSALVFTVFAQAFSLLSISLTRRLLHFDRTGNPGSIRRPKTDLQIPADSVSPDPDKQKLPETVPVSSGEDTAAENRDAQQSSGISRMTVIIFCAVALGILLGHFVIAASVNANLIFGGDLQRFASFAGNAIRIGLCILLFFVGIDMSSDNNVFQNIRAAGAKILLFPLSGCAGALLGAFISGLLLGIQPKESLAIGAGFGWYTLAPGFIMDAGFINSSAICFLHNVSRELAAILLIPFVAKRVGYIECTALAGAAAMDVCLPIVERSTNGSVAVYSFISGAVISALVPVLVPLILRIF